MGLQKRPTLNLLREDVYFLLVVHLHDSCRSLAIALRSAAESLQIFTEGFTPEKRMESTDCLARYMQNDKNTGEMHRDFAV